MCSPCISFELECHGYGPKPEWMDNGIMQRDQVSKVRDAVSRTRSKKGSRQQLTNQPPQALDDGMSFLSTESVSSPSAPSPNPDYQHFFTCTQDESPYPASSIESNSSIDPAWGLWPSNHISVMDSLFDLESYNVTPTTPQSEYPRQHLLSPRPSEGMLASETTLPMLHEAIEMSSGIAPQEEIQFPNDETGCFTLNTFQGSASHYDRCYPQESTSYDLVGPPSQVSILNESTEDTLFMYYLDQVFYVQYPFYHSKKRQGRGWLFSVLRRVKSAYHAALALSERHLLSALARNNDMTTSLVQLRTQNGHYDLANQETQSMVNKICSSSGRAGLVHSLEVLTSLIQLLFCEVRMTYLILSSKLILRYLSSSTVEERTGRSIFVQLVVLLLYFYRHGCR